MLEERQSPLKRRYLVVKLRSVFAQARWMRIRAFTPTDDGERERELTPDDGLVVYSPQYDSGRQRTTFVAERPVDWPVELIDDIRIEVLEAWRYQTP